MAIAAIRTVIIYIFIIVAMRVMGKRQLGELQPVELVVTLLISDLAAVPMQESGIPLLSGIVPILVLVGLELLLSSLMLKWPAFSRLVSGTPIILINDGKLAPKALKQLRLTIDDLMETLREQNIFDLQEIQYAIAETNGKISVFPKPENRPVTCGDVAAVPPDDGMPVVVVSDGRICEWALAIACVDEAWIRETLRSNGCELDDVFLMTTDRSGRFHILRRGQGGRTAG